MRSDDCDWRKDNKCSSICGAFKHRIGVLASVLSNPYPFAKAWSWRSHLAIRDIEFHQDGWYWRACDNITTLFYLRSGQAAFRTEAKQNHTDQNQEIEAVMGNLNALTLCHDS
ncbi:hypothetical protein SDJN03_01741, partial [Cucurbita argyrosperma subsp. sororia]